MRSSIVFVAVAACFVAPCFAAPSSRAENARFVLHEKRDGAPHQWTKRSRANADEILPVRIGLVQSNLHNAEEYILDVSDPSSPNFGMGNCFQVTVYVYVSVQRRYLIWFLLMVGKHWSAEKIANTFAPSKETAEGVVDWLVKSGIDAARHSFSTGTPSSTLFKHIIQAI